MKISVIIPTHNRLVLLKRALKSVLNQTIFPHEIIIVDDGSTTPIDIDNFTSNLEKRKSKIILERLSISQGANTARNRGAEIASGDILMFLDDDDFWKNSKIEDQVSIFLNYPEVGLVYSGILVFDNKKKKFLYKIKSKHEGKLYPKILYWNLIGPTSSVALRKSLFKKVGGFDNQLLALQDYELWVRCCQETVVKHDNQFNVIYTVHDRAGSQISSQPNRHIQAVNHLLHKFDNEIIQEDKLYKRKRHAYMFFVIAKARRNYGFLAALPWLIRSLIYFPNFKTLLLVLPRVWVQSFRSLCSRL